MAAYISSEYREVRKTQQFSSTEKKRTVNRVQYPIKISFIKEGEIKTFEIKVN